MCNAILCGQVMIASAFRCLQSCHEALRHVPIYNSHDVRIALDFAMHACKPKRLIDVLHLAPIRSQPSIVAANEDAMRMMNYEPCCTKVYIPQAAWKQFRKGLSCYSSCSCPTGKSVSAASCAASKTESCAHWPEASRARRAHGCIVMGQYQLALACHDHPNPAHTTDLMLCGLAQILLPQVTVSGQLNCLSRRSAVRSMLTEGPSPREPRSPAVSADNTKHSDGRFHTVSDMTAKLKPSYGHSRTAGCAVPARVYAGCRATFCYFWVREPADSLRLDGAHLSL